MDEHGADQSVAERDSRHDIEAKVREVIDALIATTRREGPHMDEANALEAVTLLYNAIQPSLEHGRVSLSEEREAVGVLDRLTQVLFGAG